MLVIDEKSFKLYAAANYFSVTYTEEEFKEDLSRIRFIKKALQKPDRLDDQKCRILINNIIILYNVFGPAATTLLFFKVENHSLLKTFLWFLDRMPYQIEGLNISAGRIALDYGLLNRLKKL